jgi:hypothetical protein
LSSPIDAFINAGGASGAPTAANSRYYGLPTLTWTRADGTQVRYIGRRLVPQANQFSLLRQYVVIDGDRIDNIAARQIGDPLLYWLLCDANGAMDPDDLTAQIGRSLKITLPAGIGGTSG